MHNVEIYTSDGCGFCHMAKDFFEENSIKYTEHNISKDMQARKELVKKGYMSVPLIIIDDEEILGFEKERVEKLLGL